jgi:hypothetical protein
MRFLGRETDLDGYSSSWGRTFQQANMEPDPADCSILHSPCRPAPSISIR